MSNDRDLALSDLSGVAVLGSLMAAITRSADLHSIYDAALDAFGAGLGVRRASILLFDDDGVMRFKAWRGLSEGYRRAVEGHTPWTPDTRDAATIVVPDVTADAGLAPYRATIAAEGIAAMVFVPLCSAAGVIGKFMLYFEAPRRLSAPELTLADVIAAQVAFAVQRLRAEQAAHDRETELRLVTDIAPVYIAHCDADRRYRFVNRPFAARFGLEPGDIVGRTMPEVLGTTAYESVREHVDAVLGGRVVDFEVAEQLPYDTRQRVLRGEYAPAVDPSGRVTGFIAVVTDVTDRHRALAALRTSEAQLAQLADSLPQIVWMARADGYTDYYNERWYEFTGLPRGEGGDSSWIPVLHPDDVERALACWRRSVGTGEPYTIEYRFLDRRTGGYRWHLGRALPMRDDDGRIVRWFGTCTDIDDQKRSEQHSRFLAEASRTLSTLTDYPTALQALAELAVPGFADWCAIDVVEPNGGLRRLALSYWDRTKVEFAREMERRYPSRPEDPYGPRPAVRTGRSELVPEITDAMLVASARDDEHLALLRAAGLSSVICVPVRAGAQVVGAIMFLTSDSKRRYGAADLAVAEELAYRAGIAIENARLYADIQHADRQKDEFLAVLAHELRNPLAPIRTALQLVRLEPEDGSRRARAYDVMERQLRQMVRLVDDLLDVSRITRGTLELQREATELAAVIHDAVETSRPGIEAAGHELTVTFPSQPIPLEADATRLAQVFANLLNNAAKYTPRGGQIGIAAGTEAAHAVVRVRDSGIGIPAHMLTRIFDMFIQVDRSLEKTHGGLGIGLTLARRLVEMHGGTIEAFSSGSGTGSEFVVRLPVRASAAPEGSAAGQEAARRPSRGRRVLVADDNLDAAECLAELLMLRGHDVRTANDGVVALEMADALRPDVVLLDLGMPRLSGYDAARTLRERLGAGVTLIAVTGWGQEEHRRRSRQAGFDHHLVKPVDIDALEDLLERAARA